MLRPLLISLFITSTALATTWTVDEDGDGIDDSVDNCYLYNPDQLDCNNNGVGDVCDIADGTSNDCDENGVPDDCDIAGGATDCDGNDVLDTCEVDCNVNGVVDACDIADGNSEDINSNGVPDECETLIIAYTSFEEPLIGEKYYDTGDPLVDHQLFNNEGQASVEWTASGAEMGFTAWYVNTRDSVGLTDGDWVGVTNYTGAVGEFPDGSVGYEMSDTDGLMSVDFETVIGFGEWDVSLELFIHSSSWEEDDTIVIDVVVDGGAVISILDTTGLDINDLGIEDAWFKLLQDLTGYSEATLRISLDCNSSSETIYLDRIRFAIPGALDADGDSVADSIDNCEFYNPDQADCNNNGIGDVCDLAYGTSLDCNDNGVPDECDIANGTSSDCNANGIPDECELEDNDCNDNDIPDDCEMLEDCNANGIPDECEIFQDCNDNGVIDACDIADGTSNDWNADGIPDECQPCLADVNDDGIVDISDILAVIGAWGMCACEEMPNPVGSILDKYLSNDLRVLTWNVEHVNGGTLPFHPATLTERELAPFIRVLKAIDADVIVFNEIERDQDVKALPEWLNDHVRSGIWQVHQGIDTGDRTVIASYYPMNMLATNTIPPAWTGRGVTMALIDCPDSCWSTDLYLLGVHLKCCEDPGDEEDRQDSADAIANWLGDLRTVGENIDLPQDTPMVVLGDMNFYDEGDQPELTILTGDIQNEDYYGPDIKGDWDGSDLIDPIPADPITGETWTIWGWESRADRFMVTDSVLNIGNAYILNTTELPQHELDANGLEEYDTANIPTSTSDHLPVVVDFRDPDYCRADLNFDGIVNVSDLLLIISNWGDCP